MNELTFVSLRSSSDSSHETHRASTIEKKIDIF